MPCYHPIPASRDFGIARAIPGLGAKQLRTSVRLFPGREKQNIQIPCGRCLGCKTRRSQEWAARVMHEARYHEHTLFVTLTYDPEHLPKNGHLVPRDLQLFLKKLRKAAATGHQHIIGNRVRYLASGEYGDIFGRPHYHAILFGIGFRDEQIATKDLKRSPTLEALWGMGTANYGQVTMASAAYVAGYTAKKLGSTHCDSDGVVLEPPFLRVSTRPGIGADYAHRYASDFRMGSLVVDGEHRAMPRYYKKLLETHRPDIAEDAAYAIHERHVERISRDPLGALPERLVAAETIHKRKLQLTSNRTL